jgi:hypothetical protein
MAALSFSCSKMSSSKLMMPFCRAQKFALAPYLSSFGAKKSELACQSRTARHLVSEKKKIAHRENALHCGRIRRSTSSATARTSSNGDALAGRQDGGDELRMSGGVAVAKATIDLPHHYLQSGDRIQIHLSARRSRLR